MRCLEGDVPAYAVTCAKVRTVQPGFNRCRRGRVQSGVVGQLQSETLRVNCCCGVARAGLGVYDRELTAGFRLRKLARRRHRRRIRVHRHRVSGRQGCGFAHGKLGACLRSRLGLRFGLGFFALRGLLLRLIRSLAAGFPTDVDADKTAAASRMTRANPPPPTIRTLLATRSLLSLPPTTAYCPLIPGVYLLGCSAVGALGGHEREVPDASLEVRYKGS